MEYNLDLIKELLTSRKFISLESLSSGTKKVYTLTGSKSIWKKQPNTVYSYQMRITGDQAKFNSFLKDMSNDLVSSLSELDDALVKNPTKKTLKSTLITNKNYDTDGSEAYTLYQHDTQEYTKLKNKKIKTKRPSIEDTYAAFLVYKENKSDLRPKKTPVKMESIGDMYQNLGSNDVLNVLGYASKEPHAYIQAVEDANESKFEIDGKIMYRSPNYRLISTKKSDIQRALKDLAAQDVIEIKNKQITQISNDWSELKTNSNKKEIKSPKKLDMNGDKKSSMPQRGKHKITIVS